jgi:hypothetical protein
MREVEVVGDAQDKALVNDDALRVAAVRNRGRSVLVRPSVCKDLVRAELLETLITVGAGAIRIDQAADAHLITGLELRDRGTDLSDPADDLVAGDTGIYGRHYVMPFVAGVMKIRVADAAEKYLDLNVAFRRFASRDAG